MCVLYMEFMVVAAVACVSVVRAQDCHLGGTCSWTIKSGFVVEDYKDEATKELVANRKELQNKKGKFLICLPPVTDNKCELQSPWIEPGTATDSVCLTTYAFLGIKDRNTPADTDLGEIEMSLAADGTDNKSQLTETETIQRETWNILSARFEGPLDRHRLAINVTLTNNYTFVIFDDINVDDCSHRVCDREQDFMCDNSTCFQWDRVCNLATDCLNGNDERPDLCGAMPTGSVCTFEDGLCGWENSKTDAMAFTIAWKTHMGASPTQGTGPSRDHTLGTVIGHYLYIETTRRSIPDHAILKSMVLPATGGTSKGPTCHLRFFYHMFGRTIGKLEVRAVELCRRGRKRTLWSATDNQGDKWLYAEVPITNIANWYRIHIEGHVGVSNHGDIAIDDVSFSPECYGLGHNRTHFLTEKFTNPAMPYGSFLKKRMEFCKKGGPSGRVPMKTPRPPYNRNRMPIDRGNHGNPGKPDNSSIGMNTVGVSTEPITSSVEVHTQRQQQSFNMGLGYIITLTVAGVLLVFGSALVCFGIRKRRSHARQGGRLEIGSGGSEDNCSTMPVQASAIDMQIRCAVTELNPNYDFITAKYPEQQLREIPRQSLSLTRLLGQGAFGEVYEGVLKNLCANVMELPVAVKTLPALSSEQAETDFLMEAVIISKFMHKNVVKCLGVCFEEHPRYIVLELLQGGDLRSFLRDSRPKQTQPCLITMEDLVKLALDVANGCRHLEEKHFVHRDIAARNCLLTTRESGRIAKIADFGMSRDIYSADYYRKDGKAMLPIKWMPPEAFLDGVFTSKTDVWSFGILLWEIYTLGYMPYPGQTNSDVMHFVASGGRLDPPQTCPARLNKIMLMCWNSVADIRPAFNEIIDHLDMCLQDPEVMECDLSVCHYPLAECLKDVSVLVKSVMTENSADGDTSSTVPSSDTTADYGGHVASQSREPLLPSPEEAC